jgi:hypothetical protein
VAGSKLVEHSSSEAHFSGPGFQRKYLPSGTRSLDSNVNNQKVQSDLFSAIHLIFSLRNVYLVAVINATHSQNHASKCQNCDEQAKNAAEVEIDLGNEPV